MPISRITELVESEAWARWLAASASPIDASTAVNASSTGMPAATNEPNTNSRIRNVIGTVSRSAFWKSLPIVLFSSWFALAKPNSATVKSGFCFCSAATESSTGWIRLSALSALPRMENCTSAA